MRKTQLILIVFFLMVFSCPLSFAAGKNGAKDFKMVFSEDSLTGSIMVSLKARETFTVRDVVKQKKEYATVPFKNCLPTREKGFPEVAYFKMAFQLRDNLDYELIVREVDFQEFDYFGDWLPSRGQILRNQDPEKVPYKIARRSLVDAYFPRESFVVMGKPFLIRDVRGIDLQVLPVLVNTVLKRVRILKSIRFELVPGNGGVATNRQPRRQLKIFRWNEPVYDALFANFRWSDELEDGTGDMLVIYTNRDKAAVQPFIAHKESQGFTVTETEVATGTNVKTTIQNAYNANPDLLYVQLVGDWDNIQCEKMNWDGDVCVNGDGCPEDNALGLVSGSDDYYDLIISRFSAGSAEDVTTQVNKVIEYETNPNEAWWKNGLGIASDEGPGDDGESDSQHMNIIKENKLLPNGYTNVADAYDPGASTSEVSGPVNGGVHVINYVGHGYRNGWSTSIFSSADVNGLANGNKLPFIFSVACNVGEYNAADCFAEEWLRKQNGGAVSVLMSTISQPWDPPMRGQDYMNDLLTGGYDYTSNPGSGTSTDHGKQRLGSIVFNAFNLQIAEAGSGDVETTRTWVLFGDGSLRVVGSVPCPEGCSDGQTSLTDMTFLAGSICTCTRAVSFEIGSGVTVESGATVIFEALNVTVGAGARFEIGSSVTIRQP